MEVIPDFDPAKDLEGPDADKKDPTYFAEKYIKEVVKT